MPTVKPYYHFKKIYTIRINDVITKRGIWYYRKGGRVFQAELHYIKSVNNKYENIVAFKVREGFFVYPVDCTVIAEKVLNKNYKPVEISEPVVGKQNQFT